MYCREFRERMRVFAQFYTSQEYEQFLKNLERERELRLRLSELYRYRENGITRHEECAHFEQVMFQAQSQTDNTEQWTDKKSVSISQVENVIFLAFERRLHYCSIFSTHEIIV